MQDHHTQNAELPNHCVKEPEDAIFVLVYYAELLKLEDLVEQVALSSICLNMFSEIHYWSEAQSK